MNAMASAFGPPSSSGGVPMPSSYNPPQQQQQPPSSSCCVVDAYAQSVLESYCAEASSSSGDSHPDPSLGPYVTSALRDNNNNNNNQQDQDGLVELLQDNCNLTVPRAKEALKLIADAVRTGQVPLTGGSAGNSPHLQAQAPPFLPPTAPQPGQLDAVGGAYNMPESDEQQPSVMLSPLHASKLIPEGLFGGPLAEDANNNNNEEDFSTAPPPLPDISTTRNGGGGGISPPAVAGTAGSAVSSTSEEDFPSLAAAAAVAPSKHGGGKSNKSKKKKGGTATTSSSSTIDATDLAAALFKSSIEDAEDHDADDHHLHRHHHGSKRRDSRSPKHRPQQEPSGPAVGSSDPTISFDSYQLGPQEQQNYYYYPQSSNAPATTAPPPSDQLLHGVAEMLLSMNEVSHEAALAAAHVSLGDVNVAQYLVDRAMTAPPICRHLLHDGCYRADCQYSHDLPGHTCMFWLKGRCGKGECKFKHGFDENALKEIEANMMMQQQQQQYSNNDEPQSFGAGAYCYSDPSQYLYESYYGGAVDSSTMPMQHQMPSSAPSSLGVLSSFANIATQGYAPSSFVGGNTSSPLLSSAPPSTVKIPLDLWTPYEARDSSAFQISDPMERYIFVSSLHAHRPDVIDLHFQSTRTFPTVLSQVLPEKLQQHDKVWIVTGTGHHVGNLTHQKGGGALESAVVQWLEEEGYSFARGKDRNGQGGAVLVTQQIKTN